MPGSQAVGMLLASLGELRVPSWLQSLLYLTWHLRLTSTAEMSGGQAREMRELRGGGDRDWGVSWISAQSLPDSIPCSSHTQIRAVLLVD